MSKSTGVTTNPDANKTMELAHKISISLTLFSQINIFISTTYTLESMSQDKKKTPAILSII